MAKLRYSAIVSLDGYMDERSTASPPTRCEMYETAAVWETAPALAAAKRADAPLFQQQLAEMAEGGAPC